MRVPLSWLRECASAEASTAAIAERLTLAGLAVDAIESVGPDLSAVRVGFVREREKHPNADRLSLCRVELGPDVNGGEPVEIVCGAPNVAAGQKVAVALPGGTLPDGRTLERSKIRGVISNGMICSARELGFGDEHEGILVLDPAAPIGAPVGELLGVGDVVLDLELTPNRGDCASILGVAREVRALFGGALRIPAHDVAEQGPAAARALRIAIDDADGCSHYVGRIVRGVRIGPSPDWVRRRLEAAGMRAIHNVVDVTNLVMLELGQPLHAFDLAAIRGGEVRVRAAQPGERLRTLDGQERALAPEDVVIADGARGIAIAGVMGGADTEVRSETTAILIESARFASGRIRRTARRLGLRSEASYRFERGVDPDGVRRAADRAARLLVEIAGGVVDQGAIEVRSGPPPAPATIALDAARVNRLLGTALGGGEIAALLERLEIRVAREAGDRLVCTPPPHRNDLAIAEDLVEEVARLHGYDRIEPTLPEARLLPVHAPPARALVDAARTALAGAGLVEAVMLSFFDAGDLDRLDLSLDDRRRRTVRVLNPVNEDESRLRTTLVPSLLRAARQNLARRVPRVRLFETARVFFSDGDSADGLPAECLRLAIVLTQGERASVWDAERPAPLFFEAKGLAERLLIELGVTPWFRAEGGEPYLLPGASVQIGAGERTIGAAGELHPDAAAAFELDAPCAVVELDLDALALLPRSPARYVEISNQPPVRRDLAVLVDRDTAAGEVLEAIRKTAGAALVTAEVFDRYEGKGVPEGRVSLAFRLVFQRPDRAFTDEEIARITDRVVQMLAHRFRGELR
jgi:phenylalanyl-tRNA synthetase beta chain